MERRLSSTADPKQWEAAQRDDRALVALNDVVLLCPGPHTWRIVFPTSIQVGSGASKAASPCPTIAPALHRARCS